MEKKRPYYGGGRPATGRVRNVSITIKLTEEEKKALNNKLDSVGKKNKTDALLELLKIT